MPDAPSAHDTGQLEAGGRQHPPQIARLPQELQRATERSVLDRPGPATSCARTGNFGCLRERGSRPRGVDLLGGRLGWGAEGCIVDDAVAVPLERPVAEWVMAQHGWAFPSPRKPGEHVTPDCVARRLKRILSGYSAHTLRHHYATEAYQESGDLLATQLLLGHRSPVTTIGYVQPDPARLRKAAAATWVT